MPTTQLVTKHVTICPCNYLSLIYQDFLPYISCIKIESHSIESLTMVSFAHHNAFEINLAGSCLQVPGQPDLHREFWTSQDYIVSRKGVCGCLFCCTNRVFFSASSIPHATVTHAHTLTHSHPHTLMPIPVHSTWMFINLIKS